MSVSSAQPPASATPTLWFGGYGGQNAAFVDVPAGATWQATLAAAWASFAGPSAGTGPGLISLTTQASIAPEQAGTLIVTSPAWNEPRVWPLRQFAMTPLRTLSDSTVQTPWPNVPNVMEFGIAAKWLGQQIQKIPEPFTLLALVILELLVVAAGILLITARLAASGVPEPRSWLPAPAGDPLAALFDSLREVLPLTSVNLTLETGLTALYLAQQALGE
ncbi:MAG: hypothetical protein JSR82_22975 [Verrucomicrobia bacterium]|nr:hypothetical protein [Verrucomicrobiota bacterium]